MRDWTPGGPLRQCLGLMAFLVVWAGFAVWCWLRFRDGEMTHERFVMAESGMALQVLMVIGYAAWKMWKSTRPPPPPVYRSTILD
jgi:hypothetical protein